LEAVSIAAVARVLLAEDDQDISVPLARALRRDGYDLVVVEDGRSALKAVLDEKVDLIVLDVGLPEMSGLEVCRSVRDVYPKLPILMLTARTGELETVAGLDAGADDYVAKPFRLAELEARIRRMLARAGPPVIEVAGVRIDQGSRKAWRGERELDLSPKEFDLLAMLAAEPGKALQRDEIMTTVWDPNWFGSTKTLDMHIAWLRRKLGDPPLIETVRGVGFRFAA
jgi:DNA-binding response OmpR family regulator